MEWFCWLRYGVTLLHVLWIVCVSMSEHKNVRSYVPTWCHVNRDDGDVRWSFYGKDNSVAGLPLTFVLCIKMIYRYWAFPSCNNVRWIKRISCRQYTSVDKMFDTKENEVAEILRVHVMSHEYGWWRVCRPFYEKDKSVAGLPLTFVLCIKTICRYWASPSCNNARWIKRTSCHHDDSVDKIFDSKGNGVAKILCPMWCHVSRDDSDVCRPLNTKDFLLQIFQQCTKLLVWKVFCVACLENA